MPSEIRELDPSTVERIAAGEVVERPASAVKELVENSIDADASRVTVAVKSGGIDGIEVTDDGAGMIESALRRAVEKHTTSKITDIDDLEGGVDTLGFRGEALHAIGAVSRLTITSRAVGSAQGTTLTVEGGDITAVNPAGCPEGTTVEVDDLFYNVPARRKYLKQESTEFAHVSAVVRNYALANPDVAVTLEHDGRETFSTTGQGNLRETVLSVYGHDVAESMRRVEHIDLPDGPLAEITGLVSHPETNRASREYCSVFINGRYVNATAVTDALVEAYDGQLASDRYPFAVLFLDVDPATVDVNVHPRKMEVRFADESGVREQVRTAVERTLLDDGLIRSSAPRGRSAPEQTEIRPEANERGHDSTADGEAEESTTADGEDKDRRGSAPSEPASNHSESPDRSPSPKNTEGHTAENRDETGVQRESTETADRSSVNAEDGASGRAQSSADTASSISNSSSADSRQAGRRTPESAESDNNGSRSRKFRQSGTQTRLAESNKEPMFERLPAMRILGQLHDTYVVAETDEGLVLIDQHAADERINYERLREQCRGDTTTQTLAQPVTVELTAREAALFEAQQDALTSLGFHATLTEDRTVELRTVPAFVADTAGPELLQDALAACVDGEPADTVEAAADELLADLACYPSVTGNTSLTDGSIVNLLSALDACENPYACPHGRPVIVELDRDELEGRFERDYPGHQ
ncbi:DNA mismatch repair endonuclease MutL [Halovenus marina]|uniref:DNA mismatch repair endonuclease MutL n=1 Tax=Halovenus marina TaxID=3396621 RepID=UPI003F56AC16